MTKFLILFLRDTEESAPAEYPPDQPEADNAEDDSNVYGVEETELEAALVKELADSENRHGEDQPGEDQHMEGAEATTGREDREEGEEGEEEVSDGESEDLEAESDDDEEDLDEDEAGEADEDVEMGEDSEQKDEAPKPDQPPQNQQSEVLAH